LLCRVLSRKDSVTTEFVLTSTCKGDGTRQSLTHGSAAELSRKRSRLNSLIPKIEECSWTFDGLGMEPTAQVPLRIGDTEKVRAFYEAQWRNFQQTNCRHMGKAYIKIIEPRKQVKFPYNGGKGAPGEKGDPEKTKPEWWPAGVIHREPDHLKKPDRIKLLTHILCNLRHRGIDVAKLQDAGLDAIRQIKPRDRLNILEEIYRVRHLEEQYEDGCIDGSTVIMVSSLETSRTERTDTTTDSCGRYADAAAVAKMEQDDEPASKYLRMSVPHNEGPVWPADCSPARHPSQAGLSSPRSRPSFHMDFDSQVSSLPDDDSETAPPLDYAPVPLSATMEAHDMQASVPRYNSWSSGSMQLQTTYFTTPDYSQPVNPMISQGLMIPGSYITDLAAPPCQTHS
ncbi:hypothetical protein KEM52_000172, partial [Ascosphaera acerosa]